MAGENTISEKQQQYGKKGFSYYTLFVFITRFFTFRFLLFWLLSLSLNGFSQPGAEIGVMGGGSYYLGEYNPGGHFKYLKRYLGGFYRYNLNDRFALRLNAGFSKVGVKDVKWPGAESFPTSFESSVVDISGLIEFNFRSFLVPKTEKSSFWSPYVYTGVGFLGAGEEGGVSIPLGVGVKFNLSGNFACGVEWGCRKLFTDMLDGLEDPWKTGESNFIFNKDWVFVAGITFSYRFPMDLECYGYK